MGKAKQGNQSKDRISVSFRLKDYVKEMLEEITDKNRRSMTQQLEILIEDEHERLFGRRKKK